MASIEDIINDFIKGAERAGGQVQRQVAGSEQKLASHGGSGSPRDRLSAAHMAGAKAAADHFKVAFGPLLSAGLSALAPAAARGVLGRVAPKALGAVGKPIAGALFDTGVQMGAQKALS
jgi:hypothetical protein